MAAFTDYLEKKLLDFVFGNTAYSVPATLYVGLFTVLPAEDGTGGTEVSGGSYARVAVTNNTTNFPNATGGNPSTKASGAIFTFPTATANWGDVIGMGIWDASTSGNLLAFNPLTGTSYAYTALASTDVFTAPGSSFSDTNTVQLLYDLGGTTPTGVSIGTTYYVRDSSGTTFKLAATSGGSAINISADGSGRIALQSTKTVYSGDTPSFASGALIINLD